MAVSRFGSTMPPCELTREHAKPAAPTFDPKVAGSIPARPMENPCLGGSFRDRRMPMGVDGAFVEHGAVVSDDEGSFYFGGLEFVFAAFPVAVDVGCDFEGGVSEVAGDTRLCGARVSAFHIWRAQ